MNKTEAMRVNTLLRWIMGDPAVPQHDLEDARFAARELAHRANQALGAGVSCGQVEYYFDEQRPRVLRTDQLTPEVAELLAGWWELEEGGGDDDGGPIDGGDLVQFVAEWLTKTVGANIRHPLRRALAAHPDLPDDGYDQWDEKRDLLPFAVAHGMDEFVPPVCGECGGPIRDPQRAPAERDVCRDCEAAQAEIAREAGVRAG